MNLTPFTYNGSTIQSTDYVSHLYETSHNQPRANIIEVERTNNFPSYAGKRLSSKELYLIVDMQGTAATQIDTLNGLFDVTNKTPGTLICKDSNNSDKQWYVEATPVTNEWSANSVSYTLHSDDPIWKSVTQGSVSYSGTSSPGTVQGTVSGNKYALPVFTITPTSAKGSSFNYRRFVVLYNNVARDLNNYPVNLTDNGSGTAYIAGSAWLRSTDNYVIATAAIESATALTIPYSAGTGTFPASGMAMINSEQIIYSGTAGGTITVTTRGANSTTAGTHAASANVYVSPIQADGDDIRIYVDGNDKRRWFGGAVDSGTTKVWSNFNIPSAYNLRLSSAVGTADPPGNITIDATTQDTSLKIDPTGQILIDSEIFTYSSRTVVCVGAETRTYGSPTKFTATLSGVARAKFGTSGAAHSEGATVRILPYQIFMLYGNQAATAPTAYTHGYNAYDDNKPVLSLATSTNYSWTWEYFADDAGKRTAAWTPAVTRSVGGKSYAYGGNRGSVHVDECEDPYAAKTSYTELGCAMVTYYRAGRWMPETANINWTINTVGATSLVYSGEKYRTGTPWPEYAGFTYLPEPKIITQGSLATPTEAGSWEAFSGTITADSTKQNWQFRLRGSVSGGSTKHHKYIECNAVQMSLVGTRTPYVKLLDEIANYQLDLKIENATTGEYITISGPVVINETLTIDCKNKTVTREDGTNAISYLTLDSPRDEWLTLDPNSVNSIVYTDDNTGDYTAVMTWEDRTL